MDDETKNFRLLQRIPIVLSKCLQVLNVSNHKFFYLLLTFFFQSASLHEVETLRVQRMRKINFHFQKHLVTEAQAGSLSVLIKCLHR